MTNDEGRIENDVPGVLATVADIVTDVVTGATIPAPIRRNAIKAFGRLCTAAIEIPAAYLESKAEEKRAESRARVKIISVTGDQIAKNLNVDPAYAEAAVRKYGERIVRERVTVDDVVQIAAEEIHQKAIGSSDKEQDTDPQAPEISDDWLNHFEREAGPKSSDEMKLLFGRILADEIQKPSSFSIRTLKIVGELDSRVAKLFQTLCSLSIVLKSGDVVFDARVSSLGGSAGANALLKYGLGFEHLSLLHEFGLIIPDYNSYMDYTGPIANDKREIQIPFQYQNREWGLLPSPEANRELKVHGVSFSKSGKELMRIVDTLPNDEYSEALKKYFNELGFKMVPAAMKEMKIT